MIGGVFLLGPGALAQTSKYESPLYTTTKGDGLDPNYGMPSFGTPGSKLRPGKGATSEDSEIANQDVTGLKSGGREIEMPRPRSGFGTDMETPSFTTQDSQEQADAQSDDTTTDPK